MTAVAEPTVRADLAPYWAALDTRFPAALEVFEGLMDQALAVLDPGAVDAYLDVARRLGRLGRGVEPMLAFLEEWPGVVEAIGAKAPMAAQAQAIGAKAPMASPSDATGTDAPLAALVDLLMDMQRSPNGEAIAPLLQTLAAVARRLRAPGPFGDYLDVCRELMQHTTVSIHGRHATFPSPGLPVFCARAPRLLELLSLAGLRRWVDYGVLHHRANPERQREYFGLESADARAVLQRERHGTLYADVERALGLYLRAVWGSDAMLVPYSTVFDELRKPVPYDDALGLRVPDAFDDRAGVAGIDRYRAVLAHMQGHRRWSTPQIADNLSPFQRLAVEFFEDARVDALVCRAWPGMRRVLLALHPTPVEGACDDATTSCLRHRLAMVSRAVLDPAHGYRDAVLLEHVARVHALLDAGGGDTGAVARVALDFVAATRCGSDQFAQVWFDDTVVDYRDDNRQLWRYIEQGDEEESFEQPPSETAREAGGLPPRHYPEWDEPSRSYRPDWVSLYEALHPAGDAAGIDALLRKHAPLAKQLARLLDLLKPQDKVRLRYQEDGAELDLDVALRSLIDWRAGSQPDPRINMSHRTDGRDIAVLLLLDLSESLNDPVPGTGQTILELSREAVSLLGWAIERLGDPFAIAGFQSNSRHDVRYHHLKGFSEPWGDTVKARLAAMQARWSTRMGAALRHAGHYLSGRDADKKLLLVLTDGRPADVDVQDDQALVADARRAVTELAGQGVFSYCISLDPGADAYVSDVFGRHWTVVDRIERLPETLPELFLALTR